MKINIGGVVQLLLYEVAYIAVPSLSEGAKIKDSEVPNAADPSKQITLTEKQLVIDDAHFEPMRVRILKAIEETLQWYQQQTSADSKDDPRLDNLSGCILSRFQESSEDYNWHVITSEVSQEKAKQAHIQTGHQYRLKDRAGFEKPLNEIRLGMFMRVRAVFSSPGGKSKSMKSIDIVVFH